MKNKSFLLIFLLVIINSLHAQVKIGGNPSAINSSSILELESSTKGLLIPRVSLTSTDTWGLDGVKTSGIIVYNINTAGDVSPGYYFSDGTKWFRVADAADLTKRLPLTGNVGINEDNPTASLTVSNNNSSTVPILQLKTPFDGVATDNILTWNPTDSTVRMIPSSTFSGASSPTDIWKLTGNATTVPGTNFIGTTDNKDLIFKRNNIQSGWLGLSNTAFGNYSLSHSSTGVFNTAIGDSALNKNTTGNNNTAVGHAALFNVTTGNENTAIGLNALRNTIGSGNVGIGRSALFNASGSNNIAIGYNAGVMGITFSGSNNIMVGTNTTVPSLVGSGQMNIGNSIFGTGMNGTTAAPTGNIGINVSSPNSTLHINGSMSLPIKTVQADSYDLTDKDYTIVAKSPVIGFPTDINLPAASSCVGRVYVIVLASIPPVYINGSIQILGLSSISILSNLTLVPGGYISVTLQSDGVNWIMINNQKL